MAGVGRPKIMNEDLMNSARSYVEETSNVSTGTLLPTIEGLALKLHISRDTVYEWEKENEEFSDIVNDLRAAQAQKLIQNSIVGRYNPTIAKLILSGKHNYVEKSEVDNHHSGEVSFVNDVPRPSKSS